jgi:hypothetical protein
MEIIKLFKIKSVIAVAVGALAGFGYYYFIGCKSGSCPISGNPYISTLYGAMMGLIFVFPSRKKG